MANITNPTNIVYRPFMDLEVKQDVKTMLYNANDILTAWQKKTGKRKDISDYASNSSTKEYVESLENLNTGNPVIKISRWKYGWTRMCEHLLIDFVMWLDVEFKHKVIDFVLQWYKHALTRNTIRDWYKRMSQAIHESWKDNYRDEATMINVLISWSPANNQRARREVEKMELADRLQTMNAGLIKAGMDLESRKNILIKSM